MIFVAQCVFRAIWTNALIIRDFFPPTDLNRQFVVSTAILGNRLIDRFLEFDVISSKQSSFLTSL